MLAGVEEVHDRANVGAFLKVLYVALCKGISQVGRHTLLEEVSASLMKRAVARSQRVVDLLKVVEVDALETKTLENEGFSRCVNGRRSLGNLVHRTV